ncbi:class I SAM-dependent methyltransferase [Pseudarthrobacter sp. N5]|uniref:class I SAM-dependent methyltransferase n=1 Tax=Pseudarthrobacter sp. N5 TaxID=3418416 RepID=UPI003CFAF160
MHFLRERAASAVEQMDSPDCDPDRLDRTYAQFSLVNGVVSGWRRIYQQKLLPLLSAGSAISLLDIGCGSGDLPVMLARRAARDGLRLEITAIDPDARAFRFAMARPALPGLAFRQALSSDLVREGRTFDVVMSNHVLHHLSQPELQGFLADSVVLCRGSVLHNDLRRSAAAYALFSVGSLPLRGSFIREDGLTSIRRSYTTKELEAAVPPGWLAERHSPFHQLLMYGSKHHSG